MAEMMKVILIDDEMLIRKLVRMKMDTEGLHLNIVGEFSNGASALEKIEELKPDIVISDICMPEVDGISFSEKCSSILPQVKIIIVTGYDDFDYARRSLKAGVFDYLLKPVQSDELNHTLQRAVDEINKAREHQEKQKQFLEDMQYNLPALRNIYLNQLLTQEVPDSDMEKKLTSYGVTVTKKENDCFQVVVLAIRESIEKPEFITLVEKEAEQFFESDPVIHVVKDSWGRIVIMNSSADLSFSSCVSLLVQMVEKKCLCQIQIGVSNPYEGWKDIHEAYQSALMDAQQKHMVKRTENHMDFTGNRKEWENFVSAIQAGETEKVLTFMESTFQGIFEDDNDRNVQQKAIMFLQKLCVDVEMNQQQIQVEHVMKLCRSREDLKWALSFLTRAIAMEKMMESDTDKGNKMKEIITYMKEHIDHPDLSMNFLSSEFYISTSYLSRLFRSVTGENYGDLLSDFRLLKMLELLRDSDLRDRDIGKEIGIFDAHYLSIWFRKMTGYSVTEYRKMKLIM